MARIEVSVEGRPECQRMLEEFSGSRLNNRTRRGLRAGAKVSRTEMRRQASTRGDLPRSFRKTRTRAHRNPLGVSVSPQSPLSTIFEHGAGAHTIAPKGRQMLAGKSGEHSRGRAFVAHGAVSHPGMGARPLIGPVFDASHDEAADQFDHVVFEGFR
jgi:hypothetical protein